MPARSPRSPTGADTTSANRGFETELPAGAGRSRPEGPARPRPPAARRRRTAGSIRSRPVRRRFSPADLGGERRSRRRPTAPVRPSPSPAGEPQREPLAKRPPGERRCGAPAMERGVRRVERRGEVVEQAASSARSRAWRARTGTTSRPASSHSTGQQLVADAVAQDAPGRGSSGPAPGRDRARATARGSRRGAGRGSGARVPARIAARPSVAAPRRRLTGGLGLVVGGVAGGDAGGRTASRAVRALASRFGPGIDARRGGRRRRLRGAAATSLTTSASSQEPARSPWSTWWAIASQTGRDREHQRARESAPPETAQASGPGLPRRRCSA